MLALVLGVACFPLLLKWHHHLLFLSWNMTAVVFFLPGRPNFWLVMAFLSLGMAILQRAIVREKRFILEPSIILPLVFLGVVVGSTAYLTGGISLGIFGGEYGGGRRYIMLFGAIAGFFAMTATRIPPEKAGLFVGLYFLGELGNSICSLAPFLPGPLQSLALIFPPESQTSAALLTEDISVSELQIFRPWGLSLTCLAVCYYLLARFGASGVLQFKHPWRLLLFFGFAVGSLVAGFRTFAVMLAMTFGFLFWFQGLARSRYMVVLLAAGIVLSAVVFPFASKLPMGIQRTLSLVPMIEIDPVARLDAQSTAEWRLDMWRRLLPEVPQYLILGKGLLIDARQLQFAMILSRAGQGGTFESELAGDYHNGPLSVLIPFGIFGAIGFLWFLLAALRALWNNFRNGDPELKNANGLLLALFLARIVVFMAVFGGLYADLMHFAGILGLSIALNGGIHKPAISHSFVRPLVRPGRIPAPLAGPSQ
jgi:hypothetical protein